MMKNATTTEELRRGLYGIDRAAGVAVYLTEGEYFQEDEDEAGDDYSPIYYDVYEMTADGWQLMDGGMFYGYRDAFELLEDNGYTPEDFQGLTASEFWEEVER